MYIHEEAKLCFLAHPRTGSRSTRDALKTVGFESVGGHHDGPEQGYDLSSYNVFCCVRNHWDAMVSWWYNNRMNHKELKPSLQWLAIHISHNRYYFRPGSMWFFLNQVPGIIHFHFENMEEELNAILKIHGLPEVEIPLVGLSRERRRNHYREYYDTHTAEVVRWCFGPEIIKLGYDFDWADYQGVPARSYT